MKNQTLGAYRGISVALSVAVMGQLSLGMLTPAMAAYFSDTSGHWAQQQIQTLSNQNILGGYPDGTFRPEAAVNRAEFAAMLVKALGLPLAGSSAGFSDVPSNHWAAAAIATVRDRGLISGYPGNVFMPARSISRAEALSILAAASPATPPQGAQADQLLSRFSDGNSVPQWARPAVAETIQAGIFVNKPGLTNEVDAYRPASRGEIAVMLENLRGSASGLAGGPTNNQSANNNTGSNGTVLQARVVTVPAQTEFVATLASPISSELSRVGEQVRLTLNQPLIGSTGNVVIPVGTQIIGQISQVESSARLNKDARISIDFNELILPNNQRVPIQAKIASETGELRASSTKGRVLKALGTTAVGAGLGAALGTAMGPLSGGKVGKGAIYGTAVGAGVGAAAAALDKGKELVLPTGEQLQLRLSAPISLSQDQISWQD